MSGFEITSMILTSCQTHSVQFSSNVLQPQCILPCHFRCANQASTECCLQFTALTQLSNVSWAVWVIPLPRLQSDPYYTKVSARNLGLAWPPIPVPASSPWQTPCHLQQKGGTPMWCMFPHHLPPG